MRYALQSAAMISLMLLPFPSTAAAQDLIIIRSRHELLSHGLKPILKERISRGHVVFRFGSPRISGRGDTYETVIVYPQAYSDRHQPSFTGKDVNGTLYFGGYAVVPSGWISLQVQPADAEVLLNGRPVTVNTHSGLSSRIGVLIGRYLVEARKPGFRTYMGEIEVRQASEVQIDIKLAQ